MRMAPPDVTQNDVDDEVAAIERLRAEIAEVRDERTRGELESATNIQRAELQAERARLESELALERRLLDHSQNANSTLTDAQAAMRLAAQQQGMLGAQDKVEEANEKLVAAQQKEAGTDQASQDKAVEQSIRDAERSATTLDKSATTADKAADKRATKVAGEEK